MRAIAVSRAGVSLAEAMCRCGGFDAPPRASAEREISATTGRTLPLREASQAHKLLESAAISGKNVLAVDGKNG